MARSGESSTIAPSRCERKVTPSSSSLRSCAERHDLEAAGIGQDRVRPVHESVQAAERRDAFGARAAASDDRCCRARYRRRCARTSSVVSPLTVACVPTGMKAGVATVPCGVVISPRRAAPSMASRRRKRSDMRRRRSARLAEQQAGVAVGIEAIARRDRMRIGALHARRARQNAATSMNSVERGR